MKRYKCIVAYDGTRFAGYQVQPNKITVQSEIETALTKLHKGTPVKITASGRTDAGVHARGQVIHFDSPLQIPESKWEIALNSSLRNDIVVMSVEEAAVSFHARFDTVGKEYRYFVHRSGKSDPFKRNYAYHYPYSLNMPNMKKAAANLVGTYDFTSFCSAKTDVDEKVREISEIELYEEGGQLIFRFVGNGFLYNMVRILVGTLLEVGSGAREPNSMLEIIAMKDRSAAGKTAPAHGLYLWQVFY